MSKKESWPECEGMVPEEAKELILKERPELEVNLVPFGNMVIQDYNLNRVWVFFKENKVLGAPGIG